ncbi:hypothetical protein [Pandoraea sp. NPDC087047]|uniref:hypothetical protein n=1 Tax=Pandoraea sp. NPDC087047 TaxID=3364390 RepID=UPI003801638B
MMGVLLGGPSHASTGVISTGFKDRSCEYDDGFASDFRRLGSAPASSVSAPGKPWQTYPERQRCTEDRDGVSHGRWQAYRKLDKMLADNLMNKPLVPSVIAEPLARWHASFQPAVETDSVFEHDRTEAMRQVRYAAPPENKPFVRRFAPEPVLDQLAQIAKVNEEIQRVAASVSKLPKGEAKAMGQRNLDDMTATRDTMLQLTTTLHARKFVELRVERNLLLALNDMAREARQEMSNGGADVPLRLKVRGGKLVLKPAASKSRFQRNQIRARNDAARLALLLGYPAGTPVSLADIRARGVGQYDYSTVLSSARGLPDGQAFSWFGARAAEIDRCKQAFLAVRDKLQATDGGRTLGAQLVPMHDDSEFDELDAIPAVIMREMVEAPSRASSRASGRVLSREPSWEGLTSAGSSPRETRPKHIEAGLAALQTESTGHEARLDKGLTSVREPGMDDGAFARHVISQNPPSWRLHSSSEGSSSAHGTAPSSSAPEVQASRHTSAPQYSRRDYFADQFIGANRGRAGRLSMILERRQSDEREAERQAQRPAADSMARAMERTVVLELERQAAAQTARSGRPVEQPVGRPVEPPVAHRTESAEQRALRTGARPKSQRAPQRSEEMPPPLPSTPAPDLT